MFSNSLAETNNQYDGKLKMLANEAGSDVKQVKKNPIVEYANDNIITFFKESDYFCVVGNGAASLFFFTLAISNWVGALCSDYRRDVQPKMFGGCLFSIPCIIFFTKFLENLNDKINNVPVIMMNEKGLQFYRGDVLEFVAWKDIKSLDLIKTTNWYGSRLCNMLSLKSVDGREYDFDAEILPSNFKKFCSLLEYLLTKYNGHCVINEHSC
jgi:hypothetical protein